MTSSTTPQSSLPQTLLEAHPPRIVIRAAWYTELTGQEATYFPSNIGHELYTAPPSGNPPVSVWRSIRDGVLTQAANTLINFAVKLQGTDWLKDVQPVSWSMIASDFMTLQTDAQFGKTSIYGDQFPVGILVPNPAVPNPDNTHAAGKLGVVVQVTGTYADNSTITDILVVYPYVPPFIEDTP